MKRELLGQQALIQTVPVTLDIKSPYMQPTGHCYLATAYFPTSSLVNQSLFIIMLNYNGFLFIGKGTECCQYEGITRAIPFASHTVSPFFVWASSFYSCLPSPLDLELCEGKNWACFVTCPQPRVGAKQTLTELGKTAVDGQGDLTLKSCFPTWICFPPCLCVIQQH